MTEKVEGVESFQPLPLLVIIPLDHPAAAIFRLHENTSSFP